MNLQSKPKKKSKKLSPQAWLYSTSKKKADWSYKRRRPSKVRDIDPSTIDLTKHFN